MHCGIFELTSPRALCTWNRWRTRLNFQDALSAMTQTEERDTGLASRHFLFSLAFLSLQIPPPPQVRLSPNELLFPPVPCCPAC